MPITHEMDVIRRTLRPRGRARMATACELHSLETVFGHETAGDNFRLDFRCRRDRNWCCVPGSSTATPIDGVTTAVDDVSLIRDDALHAQSLGFGGKLAIHPRQVEPILSSFPATEAEIAWAKRVLDAAADSGARKLEGLMIDRPLVERARSLLARVAAAGRADEKR